MKELMFANQTLCPSRTFSIIPCQLPQRSSQLALLLRDVAKNHFPNAKWIIYGQSRIRSGDLRGLNCTRFIFKFPCDRYDVYVVFTKAPRVQVFSSSWLGANLTDFLRRITHPEIRSALTRMTSGPCRFQPFNPAGIDAL